MQQSQAERSGSNSYGENSSRSDREDQNQYNTQDVVIDMMNNVIQDTTQQ